MPSPCSQRKRSRASAELDDATTRLVVALDSDGDFDLLAMLEDSEESSDNEHCQLHQRHQKKEQQQKQKQHPQHEQQQQQQQQQHGPHPTTGGAMRVGGAALINANHPRAADFRQPPKVVVAAGNERQWSRFLSPSSQTSTKILRFKFCAPTAHQGGWQFATSTGSDRIFSGLSFVFLREFLGDKRANIFQNLVRKHGGLVYGTYVPDSTTHVIVPERKSFRKSFPQIMKALKRLGIDFDIGEEEDRVLFTPWLAYSSDLCAHCDSMTHASHCVSQRGICQFYVVIS
eukprot:SAG31_NODE_97_length_25714_cov_19.477142_9_plen_287_part_00